MSDKLYAPQISYYIDWLAGVGYHNWGNTFTYDEQTYAILDELFTLLKPLRPTTPNRVRELWLTADRGPIEAFGDFEELYKEGEVDSYEDFEEQWKSQFPDEKNWYRFIAVDDDITGYRAVILSNRHVIEVDPRKERDFKHDISAFAEWLLASAKECIAEIRKGDYNKRIELELPPQHRTGVISRRELWDIFPKWREDFFKDITPEERQEFINRAKEPGADLSVIEDRLPTMTANDFYKYCALGYQANHYTGSELTPKEQYDAHADGRDDGLGEIDPDSPEAFLTWLHDKRRLGGHPWEICRGGNSTHIDLAVLWDEKGYYMRVAGSAWNRTVETIKIYLALKRAGLPVCLYQADILANRLTEEEKIGIVPEGIIPVYCESLFPAGNVIDFINLPCEKRKQIAKYCSWQPLTLATLEE